MEPEHGLVAVIDEGRITGVCDYQSDYREDGDGPRLRRSQLAGPVAQRLSRPPDQSGHR